MRFESAEQLRNSEVIVGDIIYFQEAITYVIEPHTPNSTMFTLKRIDPFDGDGSWILYILKISIEKAGWILAEIGKPLSPNGTNWTNQVMPSARSIVAIKRFALFLYKCLAIRNQNLKVWQTLSQEIARVSSMWDITKILSSISEFQLTNSPTSKQQNNENSNQTIIVPAKAAVITRGQEFSGLNLQGRGGQPAIKVGHLGYRAVSNGMYHGS